MHKDDDAITVKCRSAETLGIIHSAHLGIEKGKKTAWYILFESHWTMP